MWRKIAKTPSKKQLCDHGEYITCGMCARVYYNLIINYQETFQLSNHESSTNMFIVHKTVTNTCI